MPFQTLYKNIFNVYESETDRTAMLQQTVKEYPYFSLAHFFLIKETALDDAAHDTIASKTALHFNNPFLLNEQLHKEKEQSIEPIEIKTNTEEIVELAIFPVNDVEETTLIETAAALPEIKQPALNEEPMLFEPLYATDYFASQGIKLSQETQPDDKLGKQLRSFTDWLKTMKKVNENKLPEGSEILDKSVQAMAEKSNKEEVVITETMAEVFLQQGKLHKAKEIYEKFSLLNPSKIAYFAAKIEQIQ